jgi:hypothetical protein
LSSLALASGADASRTARAAAYAYEFIFMNLSSKEPFVPVEPGVTSH